MPTRPPPLPADTARAAKAVFNRSNLYLTIGDQMESLFAGIDPTDLATLVGRPASSFVLLALVTLFQFAESLTDQQAAEASRTRMDWKYALHLPLSHPGLDFAGLCEFRQQLLLDTTAQRAFEHVLTRLTEIGLVGSRSRQRLQLGDVLAAVCTLTRLEQTAEAMCLALEAVAARQPEWLRMIALSHWYERYNRALLYSHLPHTIKEQEALAQAIGSDALHLLETVAGSNGSGLARLPEVQNLRQMWDRQFEQQEGQARWRASGCASCPLRLSAPPRG